MTTETTASATSSSTNTPPFAGAGESIEVGGDRPFMLTGDGAWYVVEGNVDIFSVEVGDHGPIGNRHHRFRAGHGHLLLPLRENERSQSLIAVGTRGTQLLRIEENDLAESLAAPSHHPSMACLVDGWVELLCEDLIEQLPPLEKGDKLVTGNRQTSAGDRLRTADGTLWLRHRSGSSRLAGHPDLEIGGEVSIPLAADLWFEVREGGEIRAESTVAILGRGQVLQSLDRLYDLYLDAVSEQAKEEARQVQERLRHRMEVDRQTFEKACAQIAETLDRGAASPEKVIADGADDPVLQACRIIGAHLDLRVELPSVENGEKTSVEDRLDAIARASRFRTRQVLLRKGWWQQDGGPLLAIVEESGQPVALVPTASNRYELVDPTHGLRQRVDEEIASSLQPMGHTFYRPFPEREMGFFDLMRFGFAGCRRDLRAILSMGAVGGLLGLVTPLATRAIFNDVIPGAERSTLLQIVLILMVMAIASTLFNAVGAMAQARLQGKTGPALQAAIWDRLLSLPIPFFRPYTAGDLASRAMGIERLRQLIAGQVTQSLLAGVFSIFHFILLFSFSAELAIWATLLIAVAFIVTLIVGRRQVVAEREVTTVRNKLSGAVLQILGNVAKLRVAGAEIRAFAVWAERFSQQRHFQFEARSWSNILTSFNAGYPVLATLVIYALATPLLSGDDALRTGDFLAFMASFTTALASLLTASAAINTAASAVPLYEQAKPILQSLPESRSGLTNPGPLKGHIDVHHLSFRYQEDGPLILQDVKMHIRAREFVALVGPSGSGKSTVLRLLLGFEEPESGSIYYDGQDLAGLDAQAVRAQVGVVLQNGRLLAGDLQSNIIGSSGLTVEDAWEAAEMAGLAEDIDAMPMGMHTVITEGGGTLSGGQRQRLMIARALIRRPKILFFDEATSALDNRTQAIVTESMDRLQTTRIVVAHRLSTIQNADRIFYLERGNVSETGTYEELMESRGKFYELAKRQIV